MSSAATSTDTVFAAFVEPMRRWFTEPPSANASAFFADLADDLAGFTENQLSLGAASIRKARSQRSFPTIRECIEACAKMPAAPLPSVHVGTTTKRSYRQTEAEREEHWRRRKEAERICRCELGRQANAEMWLTALLDFATENGRLPERHELGTVKTLARRANERVHELWQATETATTGQDRADAVSLANRIEILRKAMHDSAQRRVFGCAA